MATTESDLTQLRYQAPSEIATAPDLKTLEILQRKYLGRNSALSALSASLRQLPKENRRRIGQLVNEIKSMIESAVTTRQAELEKSFGVPAVRKSRPIPRHHFDLTDCIILLAILYAGGGSPNGAVLHQIIAANDYIEKGIPSVKELEQAVNRLAAAGLVRVEKERFFLTPLSVDTIVTPANRGKSTFDQVERVRSALSMTKLPVCKLPPWKLAPEEHERAYQRYYQSFMKAYQKSRKKSKNSGGSQ